MNTRQLTFLTHFLLKLFSNLGTKLDKKFLCNAAIISDPIEKAIQKYKNHSSTTIIKNAFSFEPDTADDYFNANKTLRY